MNLKNKTDKELWDMLWTRNKDMTILEQIDSDIKVKREIERRKYDIHNEMIRR